MSTLRPCLAEEWFVEDGLTAMNGLCPLCRASLLKELSVFDADPARALSDVYRLSRAISVKHIMAHRFEAARAMDDWEALRVMRGISFMITLGFGQFKLQAETRRAA